MLNGMLREVDVVDGDDYDIAYEYSPNSPRLSANELGSLAGPGPTERPCGERSRGQDHGDVLKCLSDWQNERSSQSVNDDGHRLDRQAQAPGHPRAIVWLRLAAWDS